MTLGAGIFLMAVGAILAFAVDVSISGLDIAVVGWILMIAGAVGIALELAVWGPRRRRAAVYTGPAAPSGNVASVVRDGGAPPTDMPPIGTATE